MNKKYRYQYRIFNNRERVVLAKIYTNAKEAQEYCDKENNSLGSQWACATDRLEVVEEEIERD